MPEGLKSSFDKTFGELEKETTKYLQLTQNGIKTKGDASAFTKSGNNILRLYDQLTSKINSIDDSTLKNMFKDLGTEEVQRLKTELTDLQNTLRSKIDAGTFTEGFKKSLQEMRASFKDTNKEASDLAAKLQKSTFNTFTKNLTEGRLDLAANNLKSIQEQINALENPPEALTTWVNNLSIAFENLKNNVDIQEIVTKLEGIKSNLTGAEAQAIQSMIDGFKQFSGAVSESDKNVRTLVADEQQAAASTVQFNQELGQVKSRIQYFLGLNNAINLVKRAIRGAVDTIKDLDKAMTETAVVTDFTVKDMWEQLPEYTKRANELGVTTQAAYESATLYFQQGLNAEQAAALSTETLKMARIAGLDAAEATDRMTNALRGFNMALDEQSAQRVDDVYSQLAAHTASNVDEISTAMTKVASLAHNANMEFETTAAFLAQIIETTRESAETAGTALKTVVARFSEVKKLVDEGTLRGTDEEGQTIDVNKVGAALRTAGIDLNKYFLGEVGLDDIFIELASKWDTLTAVQQRYIATQAAGSRQQSRFIALMQDYARTQELVSMAYDAEGASQKQFEKTQDSLQSKLARLKNAWDQFLMGLTNNVVVKGFVDLLTNLLNVVNNLTSAFGDGAGTILKWIAAITAFAGIKGLFLNGGFIDKALMGLLQGTGLGNAAVKSGLLSGLVFGKKGSIAQGLTGQAGARAAEAAAGATATRTPIIFGSGSLLSKAGKGIWSGAQSLGSLIYGIGGAKGASELAAGGLMKGISGLGAGLAGIGTAAAAAAALYLTIRGIYALWLKFSPEGQLKTAQKEADNAKKELEKLDKELKSRQDLQEAYKEQTEKVENATTAADRQAAVQERNEAILSAIEEDGTLAQYVITERTDFGIELTVNEEALSNAIEDASKAAQDAAIQSQFANAQVGYAQAQVDQKELRKLWIMATGATGAEAHVNFTPQEYFEKIMGARGVSGELRSKAAAAYQSYLSSIGSAQKQAEMAYGQQLTQAGASKELTNALISVLGDVFTQTGKQLNLDQINKLVKQDESTLTKIAEMYSGAGEFFEQNLLGIDTENFDLATLGLDAKTLEIFGDLIGYDSTEIQKHIKAQIEATKEVQKQRKTSIYEAALRNGISLNTKTGLGLDIAKLSPALTSIIDNLIPSLEEALSSEDFADLLPQLVGMGEEQLAPFSNFFANFDLSNPINAFHQLNEAKQEAMSLPEGDPYRQMLSSIEKANASIFDTGNLVQSFLTSTSYDGLTSSIQDFIKANKKLTADNIEELAASCSDLQNLLEDTTATAQGLAAAFSLFENGEAPIDAITSSLIAALSAGEDFETLMSNVSKWIKDFDEGTDMKEGTEHILDLAEKATDYIYNWEFGNQPLENIYNHIFGEGKNGKGAYYDYMLENWGKLPVEEIETKLQGDIDRIKSLAENAGRGALDELINNPLKGGLTGKVTNLGNGEYTWDLDAYDSANDAIKDVAKNLGVADDAARAFIESWASHMWGMGQAWDDLNFKDKIKALSDSLSENNIITQQELDALGKETGKTADEILDAVNTLRDGTGKPIIIKVKWTDDDGQNLTGKELIDKVHKTLDELGSDYSSLTNKFYSDRARNENWEPQIDYTQLSDYLVNSLKLSDSQAKEVADDIAVQTGKQLTQDIKVPIILDDGSIKMQTETIAADTVEELASAIESRKLEAEYKKQAKTYSDAIKEAFSDTELNLDTSNVISSVNEATKAVQEYQAAVEEANQLTLGGGENTGTEQPPTNDTANWVPSYQQDLAASQANATAVTNSLNNAAAAGENLASSAGEANTSLSNAAGGAQSVAGAADGMTQGFVEAATAAKNVDQAVEDIPKNETVQINVQYNEGPRPTPIPDQNVKITYTESNKPTGGATRAAGGIVKSYAKGSENFHVKPGTALTGEEGPEIIWNKNEGYAYVTGSDGPEFQDLKPGDRVFNASETKKIFKNSSAANGGKVDSLADPQGSWNDRLPRNDKSGGSKDKDKTSAEWKNELDWLYNLLEDIAELERDQKQLEEEFEDILTDDTKTSKDLYNLLIQRLGNLNVQLDRQTFALTKREQEMREFMDTTNDQDQYLWYNWSDRTIEIDWDAIDKIVDGDVYKHVKDLISEAEEIQGKMDDAEDAIADIENQIQELENIWRDTYVDFEKRVLDAVVKSYQEVIDDYGELNDTLTKTNQEILDAIQQELDLERQIRDNTKTEDDISQKESRLAYLQRDTTGANQAEIFKLQKEIEEDRENYTDTLIDQAIERISEDNDAAAKQRDKQIEIMQAQLDYQKESGAFNEYVSELISSALSPEGTLLTDSDLYQLLTKQENWAAMSAVNKSVWEEELKTTFKEVGAFLLKNYADWTGEFYSQVAESINSINEQYQINVGSYSQGQAGGSSSGSGGGGGGDGGSTNSGNNNGSHTPVITYGKWSDYTSKGPSGHQRNRAVFKDGVYDHIEYSSVEAHNKGRKVATGSKIAYYCTVCGYAWPLEDNPNATTTTPSTPKPSGGCFAPGTKILMGNYKVKNIEDVQINDIIMAYDEVNDEFVSKRVTESYSHHNTPQMVKLTFANNTTIELTPGHPLYSTKGWKSLDIKNSLLEHTTVATLLKIGDIIINIDGSSMLTNIEYLETENNYTSYNLEVEDCHTFLANGFVAHNALKAVKQAYATGGLNTYTGLAMLHGTPSEPEYVLNARQTQAFLKLADVLPNVITNNSGITNNLGGNIYLDLNMHVDEIGSDYDVDRIADRVKDILYNASSYRNVNTINFIR